MKNTRQPQRTALKPATGSFFVLLVLCVVSPFVLSSCVTNEEMGNPQGWEEILPDKVDQLARLVPEDISEQGFITVGTNPPFAPNEFKDSHGNIIGIEMDLIKAAASVLGLDVNITQKDFPLILPSLTAGTLDVGASGFSDTPERQEKYTFVDFLDAGTSWAKPAGSDFDSAHYCGHSIAVQRGTYADIEQISQMQKHCSDTGQEDIQKLVYDSADSAANAVILERADAYMADSVIGSYTIARSDGKLEKGGPTEDGAPFGWVVPKGSELAAPLTLALSYLVNNGTYARILKPWGLEDADISSVTVNTKPPAQTLPEYAKHSDLTRKRTS